MRNKHIIALIGVLVIVAIVLVVFQQKEGFTGILSNALNEVEQTIDPKPDTTVPVNGGSLAAPVIDIPREIPQVSISGNAYDAMSLQQRTELLKDIQKIVKNEVLNQRQLNPIIPGESRCPSSSESQLCGANNVCPANKDGSCPPIPDMSQYIRKDAIPCWNCSLDY